MVLRRMQPVPPRQDFGSMTTRKLYLQMTTLEPASSCMLLPEGSANLVNTYSRAHNPIYNWSNLYKAT